MLNIWFVESIVMMLVIAFVLLLDFGLGVIHLSKFLSILLTIYLIVFGIAAIIMSTAMSSRFTQLVRGVVTKPEVQREVIKVVREEVVKDPELKKRLRQQDKQIRDLSTSIEDLTSKVRHSQFNMILVLGVFAGLITFVISGVLATRAMTPAGIGLTIAGLTICLAFVLLLLSLVFGGKRLLWLRMLLLLLTITGGVFWMRAALNHPSNQTVTEKAPPSDSLPQQPTVEN